MLTSCANTMTVQHHDRMEMQAGRLAKRGRGDDRVADSVVAFGALGGRIKSGEAPASQQVTGIQGTSKLAPSMALLLSRRHLLRASAPRAGGG